MRAVHILRSLRFTEMELLHEIVGVKRLGGVRLQVTFDNRRSGVLDCTPYLAHPYWRKLNDPEFFAKVQAVDGMLYWDDDVDMGEDDVWDTIEEQGGFSKVKKRRV